MRIIITRMLFLIIIILPNYAKNEWVNVYDNGKWALKFKAIRCKDNLNCIAIGNESSNPRILKTTDGGQSWELVYYDNPRSWTDSLGILRVYAPSQVADLSYLPNGHIYVVGDTGMVWISTDDGMTWDTLKIRAKTFPIFIADDYNISMYSNFEGLISGPYELFITNNGWQSYKSLKFNLPDSLIPTKIKDIFYPQLNIIKILGYNSSIDDYYILTSTDLGNTWETYNPIIPSAVKFYFLNENMGFAVGGRYKVNTNTCKDLIFYTEDGGKTWETQLDTIEHYPDGLSRIYFYDKNYGVAIGNWHKMWRTTNGGKYWFKDSSFNSSITADYFADIVMLSPNEMIGITDDGAIYKYTEELSVGYKNLSKNNYEIYIHPNPAREYIEIVTNINPTVNHWVNGIAVDEIRIYNILGKCVLSEKIHPITLSYRMNIEHLPSGIYYVRLGDVVGNFVKIE